VGGADARATVQGGYSNTANRLDRFELSDDAMLVAAQIRQRVDAMSVFTPPVSVADLSATQQQVVETAIAANWHSAG
jgi:hypothetical protein